MPSVGPFRALRFDPAVVGSIEAVTAPPYDVISDARRAELLEGSPWSIVRLDLAERRGGEAGPGGGYGRASRRLADWIEQGALVGDDDPVYTAYQMTGGGLAIHGVVCALELAGRGGEVLPHERTMPAPVHDRLELLRALRTHLSPVYGVIQSGGGRLHALLAAAARTPPDEEVTDDEGILHRTWRIDPAAPIDRWLEHEPMLIADGHHRYETALRYRQERRAADGPGPWDRVLTLIVDASTEPLAVRPFHRVLDHGPSPVGGEEVDDPIESLTELADEDLTVLVVDRADGRARTRRVRLDGSPPTVMALHEGLLDGADAGALHYTTRAEDAVDAVASGSARLAYLLPATTTEAVRRVVAGGRRLPEKSTYFWPKPRTGMVMMPLDDGRARPGRAIRRTGPRRAPAS